MRVELAFWRTWNSLLKEFFAEPWTCRDAKARFIPAPNTAMKGRSSTGVRTYSTYETATFLPSLPIMDFAQGAQSLGSGFRSQVPLRRPQHLVSNHEFRDGCRAQQRRIIVRVNVPLRVGLAVGGTLMEPHAVWKRHLEQIVVTDAEPVKNLRQGIAFRLGKVVEGAHMANAQQHDLEGPYCPEGRQDNKVAVSAHDALFLLQFKLQVIAQQARAMLFEVFGLR